FYLFYLGVVELNLDSNKYFIGYYLFGTGNYHLYFILTVLQFYVLFPVLQKIKKGLPLLLTYAFSTILTVFWQLNYEQFSIDIPVIGTFVMSRAFIFNWISYFILGIIFSKYYDEIIMVIKKYKTLLYIYFSIEFLILL